MKPFVRNVLILWLLSWSATGQGKLVAVEENGPRDNRINLVFLSEGYTAANMPAFTTHVNQLVATLFSREPWEQYRNYCNVYRIEIPSNQSGTDNGTAGGDRDTYFSSGFVHPSIPQLCTLEGSGLSRAYSLLNAHVPEYDLPVVLVNDLKYGGSGGPISVATTDSSSAFIVEHEIGHSFVGLSDEYDFDYPIFHPVETPNNTAETERSKVKWRHWFDMATPVPTPESTSPVDYSEKVGLFEGSMYRTSGWYRPHLASMMRLLQSPCGQVNREQFVLKYYLVVSPVDSFEPSDRLVEITGPEDLDLVVTPMVPSGGAPALTATWLIDGIVQEGETGMSFGTISDALGNGTHSVSVTLQDPTPFVRLDPNARLQETVTWTFNLSNQLPYTLPEWRTAFGDDLANGAGDGLANLVKYGLGISPLEPAAPSEFPNGSITTVAGGDYLTLTVPRRVRRTDLDYRVETSGDLIDWHSGTGHTVLIQDSVKQLVVRDAVPAGAMTKRFIRLKVRER